MNNPQPLISVIIPCYNAEKYLEEAVRSIMQQSYENLEIICINDGSTDGTLAILNRLSSIDNRISVINNPENLKLIKTLNKGISIAKGVYIARMDADDISAPERLSEQLSYLKEFNLDLCGTYVDYIKENGNFHSHCTHFVTQNSSLCFVSMFESPLIHPSILVKSDVLKKNNYIESAESYVAEDYYLWCKLFRLGLKMGIIPKYHLKYRLNEKGESIRKRDIQYKNHFQISHRQQCFFAKTQIAPQVENLVLGRNISRLTSKSLTLAIKEINRIQNTYLSLYNISTSERNEIRQWVMSRELYILFKAISLSSFSGRLLILTKLICRSHYFFSKNIFKTALYRFIWVLNTIKL